MDCQTVKKHGKTVEVLLKQVYRAHKQEVRDLEIQLESMKNRLQCVKRRSKSECSGCVQAQQALKLLKGVHEKELLQRDIRISQLESSLEQLRKLHDLHLKELHLNTNEISEMNSQQEVHNDIQTTVARPAYTTVADIAQSDCEIEKACSSPKRRIRLEEDSNVEVENTSVDKCLRKKNALSLRHKRRRKGTSSEDRDTSKEDIFVPETIEMDRNFEFDESDQNIMCVPETLCDDAFIDNLKDVQHKNSCKLDNDLHLDCSSKDFQDLENSSKKNSVRHNEGKSKESHIMTIPNANLGAVESQKSEHGMLSEKINSCNSASTNGESQRLESESERWISKQKCEVLQKMASRKSRMPLELKIRRTKSMTGVKEIIMFELHKPGYKPPKLKQTKLSKATFIKAEMKSRTSFKVEMEKAISESIKNGNVDVLKDPQSCESVSIAGKNEHSPMANKSKGLVLLSDSEDECASASCASIMDETMLPTQDLPLISCKRNINSSTPLVAQDLEKLGNRNAHLQSDSAAESESENLLAQMGMPTCKIPVSDATVQCAHTRENSYIPLKDISPAVTCNIIKVEHNPQQMNGGIGQKMNEYDTRVLGSPPSPGYKYKHAPVRKKEERAKLNAHDCKECTEYFNALGLNNEEKLERIKHCSRHREKYARPCTPEHFWSPDFPSTMECKNRGYMDMSTQYRPLRSKQSRPK